MAGALASPEKLGYAVDDQRDEDQHHQGPADERRRLAVPRAGLGFLVYRFGGLELIRGNRWRGRNGGRGRRLRTVWLVSAHAVVGMLGRLIVEVIRWAVACHGTDGTDPTCQTAAVVARPRTSVVSRPAQNVSTLSMLTNMPWPVRSFVKRVPSAVALIVQPCAL